MTFSNADHNYLSDKCFHISVVLRGVELPVSDEVLCSFKFTLNPLCTVQIFGLHPVVGCSIVVVSTYKFWLVSEWKITFQKSLAAVSFQKVKLRSSFDTF